MGDSLERGVSIETVLNLLPSPVLVHAGGRLRVINGAFARLFRIEPSAYLGGECELLLRNIGFTPSAIAWIIAGSLFSNIECRCSQNGPPELSLVLSQTELGPSIGAETVYLVVMTDITWRGAIEKEKEALHRELLEAQKLEAIGKLASGIAHEINTPSQYIGDNLSFLSEAYEDLLAVSKHCLSVIDGLRGRAEFADTVSATDRLRQEKDADFLHDEVPTAIAQAQEGIRQISGIVLAMKDFSHPSSREEKSLLDINHALGNIITISRNEWKYVCRVEASYDPGLPPVPCLTGALKQVFLNLLVNAAHAVAAAGRNAETGRILVETSVQDPYVVVRVSDNGTGIEPAIQDKVFDPFFTTKEVGKGTGQGLAIARDIVVTKHNGTIAFKTDPRQGTTFTVKLPIAQPITETGSAAGK